MDHQRWDEHLVAEHEIIERAMAVLEIELGKLLERTHDAVRVSRALDFLLEFGDGIHNQKEEQALFPLLEAHGIPRQGPIGVMLREHEAERALLRRLLAGLPDIARASDEDRQAMVAQGRSYLKIRAEHIWKENDVLYAMGRKVLTDAHNTELLAAFRRIDPQTHGADALRHFSTMVSALEKGGATSERLIRRLSYEQIDAMLEALPVEVTFVDANDEVAYFNRLDKEKLFPRTRSVIGRKVLQCHPEKSVHVVEEIVESFRTGSRDRAEFWIDFKGDKVLIRYFPVRDESGAYLGVVEVTQAIGALQKLTGQKRLLD